MNTETKLIELLMPILGIPTPDQITPQSALVKDLGAESIDFVEILYAIETELGVKIKIQEIAMTEYSSQGEMQDGKITAEIAAKLNQDFKTERFKEGQTVKELFESFTVRDLATVIERKKNSQ
ncbi:MAG: phosphopantetheine-binding protein [Bacteroidales bacterium]|nr:phosphopantetheine-binding protein [Bacteroidales bacterium]MDD3300908.1 phosphopantetheine-binding protein [Bacteroidales bacterium]MDD3844467.1 phosphopantetheine-binding protein [Bacteroidales bacterium]MDD4618925.1 phosphopantetheine-binding protein [Bacteroidales bacterium]